VSGIRISRDLLKLLDRLHERVGITPFFHEDVKDIVPWARTLSRLENHDLLSRHLVNHVAKSGSTYKASVYVVSSEGVRRLEMFKGNRGASVTYGRGKKQVVD
jgi:hypothetical protein